MTTLTDILGKTADDITAMNLDRTALQALHTEAVDTAKTLFDATGGELTGENAQRFNQATTIAPILKDLAHDAALAEIRSAYTGGGSSGAQVIDRPEQRSGWHGNTRPVSTRDNALRTLDRALADKRLTGDSAEVIEQVMTTGPSASQSWAQRWAITAGDPAYERAFAKLLTGERGHLLWTAEEGDAYRAVEQLQSERAMGIGALATGGAMVPMTLDPAIMLTSGGSTNPLRQLARVVQTTGDAWHGVTSAGVTAEWKAEAAQAADASPTLAQPKIPVHLGDAFVPYSYEAEGDAANLGAELGKLLADAADQLTAAAFTNGTGSGQPTGLVTALAAATGSKVDPATAETLATTDLYKVQNALPPRFQAGATWQASLAVINALRQFETGNGAVVFPGLQESSPSLLGRPVHENSALPGVPNPAATAAGVGTLVYGDIAAAFTIVDRIGSTVEHIPNLFGADGRPTGQRGLMLWFRTGSDLVVPNAVRTLTIPTTA